MNQTNIIFCIRLGSIGQKILKTQSHIFVTAKVSRLLQLQARFVKSVNYLDEFYLRFFAIAPDKGARKSAAKVKRFMTLQVGFCFFLRGAVLVLPSRPLQDLTIANFYGCQRTYLRRF
ncbi:MAG: hypothetical protein ACK4NS_03545 [Saprospiraceae bacterium]